MGILSVLIFLPLLSLVFILFSKETKTKWYSIFNLSIAVIQLAISLFLFIEYYYSGLSSNPFFLKESTEWINFSLGSFGQIKIDYFVALDGLSLSMILLTSIVLLVTSLSSWNINKSRKAYFALFQILNLAIFGVFLSLDFFLFYVFFELMLLPLFFLIGIWGGERREFASLKFFIYTLIGSVLMLVVMVALYFSTVDPITHIHSFNILNMSNTGFISSDSIFSLNNSSTLIWGFSARNWGFFLLFIAFAIKIPIIPFHTWLPDAHVEASTPVSIILAALLLKVGTYGLIRICYGIFPDVAIHYAYIIGILGMIAIVYGGLTALAQKDLKRMIAFSSISQMGFVVLGISSLSAEGFSGAAFQMFSHGILSTALFFIVGIIYDRTNSRTISDFHGLIHIQPMFAGLSGLIFFASLGMPGFSTFIGEFFTLLGAFNADKVLGYYPKFIVVFSAFGILISAGYFLWAFQRMFFGDLILKVDDWKNSMTDLSLKEKMILASLGGISLTIGVFPSLLFNILDPSLNAIVTNIFKFGLKINF